LGRCSLSAHRTRKPTAPSTTSMPGPPLVSLVKYDTPSLLTTKEKKGSKPPKAGKKLPPVEGAKQMTQTEDILNSILPPREWTE